MWQKMTKSKSIFKTVIFLYKKMIQLFKPGQGEWDDCCQRAIGFDHGDNQVT